MIGAHAERVTQPSGGEWEEISPKQICRSMLFERSQRKYLRFLQLAFHVGNPCLKVVYFYEPLFL